MQSNSSKKDSHIKFKKGPIFDEEAYRGDFYKEVLQVQPLFLEAASFVSALSFHDQNGAKDPANQQTISLKPYILEKIKANLVDKVKTLNSENQSIDSAIANQDHLEQVLSNINELLNLTARHENQQLNELLQIEDTQLRDALFNILQNIYLVLQLSKDRDELKVFYEIDSHVCLKTLFSNEQSSSLTDAVSFLVNKFEEKRKNLLKDFLKKQMAIKKLVSSKKINEFLKACQDEVTKHKQVSKLVAEENEVKTQLFVGNYEIVIAENTYYDVFGQKDLTIAEPSETLVLEANNIGNGLNPKMTQQIKEFSEAKTSDYMSHSSVSEYEQHILSFVNSICPYINSIEKEVFNAIQEKINDFKRNLHQQSSTHKSKTALYLLSQEFLFPQIRNAIFSNPRIQQWLDLLFSNDNVMQWFNISIYFLTNERLKTRDFDQKKTLSKITYVCSLVDGMNFVLVNPTKTTQKKLELYTHVPHLSHEMSISSQEIKVNQQFSKLLENLVFYVKCVYKDEENTEQALRKLKASISIFGIETNNYQELTADDFRKFIAQFSEREEIDIRDIALEESGNSMDNPPTECSTQVSEVRGNSESCGNMRPHDEKLGALLSEIKGWENKYKQCEQKYHERTTELHNLQREYEAKLSETKEQLAILKKENEISKSEIVSLKNTNEALKKREDEFQEKLMNVELQNKTLKKNAGVSTENSSQMKILAQQLTDIEIKEKEYQKILSENEKRFEALKNEKASLKIENDALKKENESLKKTEHVAREQAFSTELEIKSLMKKLAAQESRLNSQPQRGVRPEIIELEHPNRKIIEELKNEIAFLKEENVKLKKIGISTSSLVAAQKGNSNRPDSKTSTLETENRKLKADMGTQKENYEKQIKSLEQKLNEHQRTLQQELVDALNKIKSLENENNELKIQVQHLTANMESTRKGVEVKQGDSIPKGIDRTNTLSSEDTQSPKKILKIDFSGTHRNTLKPSRSISQKSPGTPSHSYLGDKANFTNLKSPKSMQMKDSISSVKSGNSILKNRISSPLPNKAVHLNSKGNQKPDFKRSGTDLSRSDIPTLNLLASRSMAADTAIKLLTKKATDSNKAMNVQQTPKYISKKETSPKLVPSKTNNRNSQGKKY